ncbi:MAG: caspase domain-containing protein [Lautropia sp.]
MNRRSADHCRSADYRRGADSMIRRRLVWAGLAAPAMFGLSGAAAPVQAAPARTALVIGNSSYPNAVLANPVRDARLIAATLRELGFEVALVENARRSDMLAQIRQWLIGSARADVRAFYYAGHGVQYRGASYLVPIDAVYLAEDEIPAKSFDLAQIVEPLSRLATGVNFVIMDACRAEPAALLTQVQRRTRSLERPEAGFGLTAAPRGTVIAYSTSPGALAADGAGDANSVFTRNLVNQMRQRGLPVETLFKRVRMAVMRETRNVQIPWETSSLVGDFCLRPNSDGSCAPEG